MTISDLQATVTIGGNSMSGNVVSVQRDHSMKNIGQAFTVVLDEPVAIDPWDTVVITEQGQTVLTGYVGGIAVERPPNQVIVTGMDTWKRATDYFLDDSLYTNEETVGYWIGYLCGLAGLSYTIVSTGSDLTTGLGVPLGLRPLSEALITIATRALWNIRVLASGTVEFVALELDAPEHVITEFEQGEYEVGDLNTRNVVKIWGWDNHPEEAGGSMLYQETRVIDGIEPDRIMVFADPMIDTEAEALDLATATLGHFANLDEISRMDVPGDPDYEVGDVAQAEVLAGTSHVNFITDFQALTSDKGYRHSLTIGRKDFLLPFYTTTPTEEGDPGTPVEFELVPGLALSIYVHSLYVYVAGYEVSSGSHIYRLEKRLASSGSLLWVASGHWSTPSHLDEARGVWADDTYVYVLGYAANGSSRLRTVQFNAFNGTKNWETPHASSGFSFESYRMRGDSTGVYALVTDKGWLGTDSAARLCKMSRIDGTILWTADAEIDRSDDPAPPSADTVVRFFPFDLDVSDDETYVLVGGAVGNANNSLITPASRRGLRAHYDKTTGTLINWITLDGESGEITIGSVGFLGILQYDRFLSGISWGGGRYPTIGLFSATQYLVKNTGLSTLVDLDGPDNSPSTAYYDICSGLLYNYQTWHDGTISKIRAVTKGTAVQAWLTSHASNYILRGMSFYRPQSLLWACGQKDSNFYSEYRTT